jgi:signal transduction histidine kinase
MYKNLATGQHESELGEPFNSVPIALGVMDTQGILVYANAVWKSGRKARQVPSVLRARAGANCLEQLGTSAQKGNDSARRVINGIERVINHGAAVVRCEFCELEPEVRWFDLHIGPSSDGDGVVISSVDITAAKRAAAATANQIDELCRVTRATTMSLLAAAAGHELHQPLLVIMANADAALREMPAEPTAGGQLRELITGVSAAALRATEIIKRMRNLLSGGAPEHAELDLNQLVRDVVELLGDDAVHRQIQVNYQLDPTGPTVRGDRIQLQQVLINLILNSFDASTAIAIGQRSVTVTTKRQGNNAEICIKDHGPGLAPSVLQRIFEPFYTTKRSGMGIGLYITRAIVVSHGGSITARNYGDHGLSMCVTLPVITYGSLDRVLASIQS